MTKADKLKQWINDTQMYQRIAGIAESTVEELTAEWQSMKPAARKTAAASTETHRAIQRVAGGK